MIRHSTAADIDRIMEIYAYAREFMRRTGNPDQWGSTHPPREVIEADVASGRSYVMYDAESGHIYGTFYFFIGEDPTYSYIEDGTWDDPDEIYGTIHRIAGDGTHAGVAAEAVGFCGGITERLRMDTHKDNRVMQHVLEKNGFCRCGIIYLENGSPRIAYQYKKK